MPPAGAKSMPQAVRDPPVMATEFETGGGSAGSVNGPALRAADWLCLAATPTFAIMALLTGVHGGAPPDMLCSAAQDASPLSGMVPMYLLMSAFHSPPWLKLISGRRRHVPARPDPASPDRVVPNLPRPSLSEGHRQRRPAELGFEREGGAFLISAKWVKSGKARRARFACRVPWKPDPSAE